MAVPGRYTVRLAMGSWNAEAPLVVRADPRVTQDGVTQAVLEDQLAHNLLARDLVSDLNHLVDRVRSARQRAASARAALRPHCARHPAKDKQRQAGHRQCATAQGTFHQDSLARPTSRAKRVRPATL